ncbi:MAG: hypothetical protein QW175_00930 [Candidatus Bathyarchaeia archaeon]
MEIEQTYPTGSEHEKLFESLCALAKAFATTNRIFPVIFCTIKHNVVILEPLQCPDLVEFFLTAKEELEKLEPEAVIIFFEGSFSETNLVTHETRDIDVLTGLFFSKNKEIRKVWLLEKREDKSRTAVEIKVDDMHLPDWLDFRNVCKSPDYIV